jgi:ribosomal protein S3
VWGRLRTDVNAVEIRSGVGRWVVIGHIEGLADLVLRSALVSLCRRNSVVRATYNAVQRVIHIQTKGFKISSAPQLEECQSI